MQLRNGEHGYGLVTKVLHWAIVAAIAAQLAVGYLLDAGGHGRGRGRGRGGGSGRGRGRGGDDGYEAFGDDALLTTHVVLGLTILSLATIRLAWRLSTPLPPWADGLSHTERTVEHWTERLLYVLMFAIPLTGLALWSSGDELLALHVASHLAFFVAITVHVGLVLRHTVVRREHHLRRML